MILLDTHVWWWSINEPENLSDTALQAIKETKADQRAIASISIWEFAMMVARKKIELKITPAEWLLYAMDKTGIRVMELSPGIAIEACSLPGNFHKDPADRIIVATARINHMTLITKDHKILEYPEVKTVWYDRRFDRPGCFMLLTMPVKMVYRLISRPKIKAAF